MAGGITFGAIRWDAWWSLDPSSPTIGSISALSDADYQFRAPIHAEVLGANRITLQPTQSKFDDEINFASEVGGPNFYWNYLLYSPGDSMRNAINFHMGSSIASKQKYTLMVATDKIGTTNAYQDAVSEIVGNCVQKGLYFFLPSGKPLLYLFYSVADLTSRFGGSLANMKAATDFLRNRMTVKLGVAPYFCVFCGADDATRQGLGADAVGSYTAGFNALVDGTYAQLDASAQSYWSSLTEAVSGSGGQIIPPMMMGWGSFPRHRRPETYTTWTPEHAMRYGYVFPTSSDIQSHVQAGINFINNNPTVCPQKTMCAYAWNENSEGGWLTKTLGDPIGTRLQTIGALIA